MCVGRFPLYSSSFAEPKIGSKGAFVDFNILFVTRQAGTSNDVMPVIKLLNVLNHPTAILFDVLQCSQVQYFAKKGLEVCGYGKKFKINFGFYSLNLNIDCFK